MAKHTAANASPKKRKDRRGSKSRLGGIMLQIVHRDGHACVYCGATEESERAAGQSLTSDHVVPHIDGGRDEASNLVTACLSCNSRRRNTPLDEWCATIGADPARIRALAAHRFGAPPAAPAPTGERRGFARYLEPDAPSDLGRYVAP